MFLATVEGQPDFVQLYLKLIPSLLSARSCLLEVGTMKWFGPLLLLIFLVASPVASQVPDDKLIVPGVRIGKWTLELTVSELTQMNGRRSFVGAAVGTDLVGNFTAHCWDLQRVFQLCAFTADGRRVEWLRFDHTGFATEKGVKPGGTRQQVAAAYGTPTADVEWAAGSGRRIIYDQIGLTAHVTSDGAVANFVVFRPGMAKTVWKF